ncbi:MAG: DUF4911 domain-containing protein [Desulfotalea sp.]
MNKNLEQVYLRIAPSKFHILKFILEGYDNLAILSSEDGKAGIVRLKYPEESRKDVFALLADVAPQISPWTI